MENNKRVRIDKDKNRIYLYFKGFMTPERARELRDLYKDAISQCEPKFTTVTFSENYKPSSPEVQDIIHEMTKAAEEGGVKKVARVTGDSPLGAMQINRIAKSNTSYPSKHFRTLNEAEQYLDSDEDVLSVHMEGLTKVDPEKNRIYIRFPNSLDVEKAKELKEAYRKAIEKCKPGFTTLTYAINFKPASQEAQDIIAEMTEMDKAAGISKVARVVGDSPIGGMQIDRLSKSKYQAKHFRTEAEAIAYLDEEE
ncbi:MAG: hypothetical protein R6V04_16220 [bacterium]